MDDAGNVLVRRYSKSNVYVKSTASAANEETAIGSEVLKAPNHSLDHDKVVKVRWNILNKFYLALKCSGKKINSPDKNLSPLHLNQILLNALQIFDMKKFQSNVNRELSRSYPDRRRLETQCLSLLTFVKSESDLLDCPIWILIVNVVAMDMLKSKLPPGTYSVQAA